MTGTRDSVTANPARFAFATGLLSGVTFIVTTYMTTRAPAVYIPYLIMLLVTGMFLRAARITPFSRRFTMAFATFSFSALLFFVFIMTVASEAWRVIPLFGHAWRLALVLGGSALFGAAVAQVTAPRA